MHRWIKCYQSMGKAALLFLLCLSSAFATQEELTQSFTSKVYHYSLRYPAVWIYHDKGKGVVIFENKKGTDASPFLINLQTLFTKKGGGEYPTIKALMDDFWSQVPKHTERVNFLDRKPILLLQPDGTRLMGEQTTLTFYENGQTFKHWQVMMMSRNGLLFQAWAYRAPLSFYEANKAYAEAMLASWVID
jgi:hypothetical protein